MGVLQQSPASSRDTKHRESMKAVEINVPDHFEPVAVATKLALSLGVGLLIGLEREWSRKDVGVRTFSISALLGTLTGLLGTPFALAGMAAVGLLIIFANLRSMIRQQSLEITTSVALIVTVVLGILIADGHFFTPIAAAIVVTMLLSLKTELTTFAGGLRTEEIRSAVLLGLIGFVIYPILPNEFLDPWRLLNPREAWITVIVLAGIGFVNYVLLRLYGSHGMYFSALLGGLVNSTATVAELTTWISRGNRALMSMTVAVVLLTTIAMFIRNMVLLVLLAPPAALVALWPMLAMMLVAGYFVWKRRGTEVRLASTLELDSPVSLKKVLNFGVLFLLIQVFGRLGERYFGQYGFFVVSFFGGLVSSASTTAAAANMSIHGSLPPNTAAIATVLTSISSALVNLPIVYRQTKQKDIIRTLGIITFLLVLAGIAVLIYRERFWPS